LTPGSEISKKIRTRIRDEQSGSYSESLETIFWVRILKFFDADRGSGMGQNSDPGWKKFESGIGINIPDPQHC
jgi:hypothetical protein